MKIYAISDLHGQLPDPADCPPCDLLLIGGDICPDGLDRDQFRWLDLYFRKWLESLPAVGVIVSVAGNHDFTFQNHAGVESLELPWIYLRNESTCVDDLWIYGTPYVPNLPTWAFFAEYDELEAIYSQIPEQTNIILSHGPAYGYGDKTCARWGNIPVGAQAATDAIDRVKPLAYVCGHIHEGRGSYARGDTAIYNVASVDENYIQHGTTFIEIDL